MALRSSRVMTSVFLVRDGQLLLLFRRGSRAIPDSWVGVGGHVEPTELADPAHAALREVEEEIGVSGDQLSDLSLRYVALRDSGVEVRTTYYFTARLGIDVMVPEQCDEGDLCWYSLDGVPADLDMPPTARAALRHWLDVGQHDDTLRLIAMLAGQPTAQVVGQ